MKKHLIPQVIIALVLVTGVFAIIHLATRPTEEFGALQVIHDRKTVSVSLSQLPLQDVSGTTVNGKGEEKTVDGKGTPLSDVLAQAGIDLSAVQQVTVASMDEFSAVLTAQEAAEPGKAYLMQKEGDERPRLVVFSDPDSKRQVKDVVRIVVE